MKKLEQTRCYHLSQKTNNDTQELGIVSVRSRLVSQKVLRQQFSCNNFSPKKVLSNKLSNCGESTSCQTPHNSSAHSQAKYFFLLNQLKISTVTDLTGNFKSQKLSRKISISERLKCGMHLKNDNESKCMKVIIFSHKMNVTVLVFLYRALNSYTFFFYLQNSKLEIRVKFLLI